jgi:glycosyltransferase involved in cell wall biosynthesis
MPDLWPEELVFVKTGISLIMMPVGKALAKLAYKLPHIIITVSDLAANLIYEKYYPKKPVYSLPVGVDTSKFPIHVKNNSRTELIKREIFPLELNNKFIILYSGLISEAQQVENLAYAAEKLKSESEIAIVIIGEGPQKPTLKRLKTEMQLDNFYLLPSQPRNLMPIIISSVDVCTIMLSPEPIFQIAIPTKFYEYLASKKPMIGVCEGELANIINSNNIGRTVTSGNAEKLASHIKDFKNSPIVLQTMENNCTEALQKFSLENISSDLDQILKKEWK